MPIDVARARRETPGCAHVAHFNNAGAALMPQSVLDAMRDHLDREARLGGYEAHDAARDAVEQAYDAVAALLHAHRDEIALVENATRAWDMAFYGLPLTEGDRILTTPASYASNYIAFLQRTRRTGARVEVVATDEAGQIDLDALRNALDDRVKLIALTHVPTNGGLVNPAAAVGQIARDAGIPYLLDACQSAGQLPLDVGVLGADMLSGTSRKFLRGPRGVGFLYVRRDFLDRLDPPLLDLHAATWTAPDQYELRPDARRFETWETNVAARIAFGVAVDYALSWGIDAIWARVQPLAETLRERLRTLPGVHVRDLGRIRCGIVTFHTDAVEAAVLQQRLRAGDINVSVATPRSTLLDAEGRQLPDLVRASVHYYNTEDEIDHLCTALADIV
ncbi:MAG: aminotransferase class V-fold PLP-dependent enzyme [Bacteroidetes bacterium]|jgi:selenocysteine lyase/cysteine desulfurase|nr:aminotransferase class V-fold PLP-dependent enzyme [Bacteroidota bacterium]